jgi:hypothetical protein
LTLCTASFALFQANSQSPKFTVKVHHKTSELQKKQHIEGNQKHQRKKKVETAKSRGNGKDQTTTWPNSIKVAQLNPPTPWQICFSNVGFSWR